MSISKHAAAIASLIFGIVIIVAKVTVALLTGSLSILAESIDAALDLLAAGVTILAVHVAERPPDDNHPYGHARADNLGALAQTMLLMATAVWILWQAFVRIFVQPEVPALNIWSFLVIIISLAVNLLRVFLLHQATSGANSPALKASLVNFTNDMIGSLVVLCALGMIALSGRLPFPFWLIQRLDALAAAFVAFRGLYLAWGLGIGAIRALMDDVPPELNQRLVYRISKMPDVVPDSANVRLRFVGEHPYVEVTVGTSRDRSLEEAHQLADDVEQVVRAELNHEASVLVHVEPARVAAEPYATAVYSTAQRLGLRVHNLDIYQLTDGVRVEMDLELPGSLTLEEAHQHSEHLEAAISEELPCQSCVFIHLEPRRDEIQPAVRYMPIMQQVQQALVTLPDAPSILGIETLLTDVGIIVALQCDFPGATPLTEVHKAMTRIEHDLRRTMPGIARVQIDPEPTGQARRQARQPCNVVGNDCLPTSELSLPPEGLEEF